MIRRLFKWLVILLAILAIELISLNVWANAKMRTMEAQCKSEKDLKRVKHEIKKKELGDQFQKNKYLATGKDVYQRIYNTPGQSVIDLIMRLAQEAFPYEWKCEVGVEEFTNFILLVHASIDGRQIENDKGYIPKVIEYIIPVMTYTGGMLKNVCIFDSKHKCLLFFDEDTLYELYTTKRLSSKSIAAVRNKGSMFTRYNSVKIDFQQEAGHILLPVVVSGAGGIYECLMMLDTGASKTVISLELAQKTGFEDLNLVKKIQFSTAKGILSCPIVERNVRAGNIGGNQEVAVNVESSINLLGMDFFENKNYVIDASSNGIYVWSK